MLKSATWLDAPASCIVVVSLLNQVVGAVTSLNIADSLLHQVGKLLFVVSTLLLGWTKVVLLLFHCCIKLPNTHLLYLLAC